MFFISLICSYSIDQITLKTNQLNDLTEKLYEKRREVHKLKKQLESLHSEKITLQRSLECTTQERDNFRILQAVCLLGINNICILKLLLFIT